MKIVGVLPRDTRVLDPVFIPISDGVRLAARVWLPVDAEQDPVPAVLEYLPYRRRDGTAERDTPTHVYVAGHGYACIRVDMRGTGDSEGVLLGEYLKQEQDDALEIIDWIARQSWCAGSVGMIGLSWGGFNGLQIAARRPPALKAIVSICATDDRYADDCHYMGGCLVIDKFSWGGEIFSTNTTPPDPQVVGDKWFDVWMDRLKGSGLWLADWLEHQTRDDFYKHGSVCENFADIEAAVYAVGGWADGYSNALFRLLDGLKSPRKVLVGPWGHQYPHMAGPGPAIGFLQECIRWWDYWLKGIENGIMEEKPLRYLVEDPIEPRTFYEERTGRWFEDESWPPPDAEIRKMYLNTTGLGDKPSEHAILDINSPLTVGIMGGEWCPYGAVPDQASDQRMEAGGSLIFDSARIEQEFEVLGPPVAHLEISCDKPVGTVAVCLSEILPGGAVTRITYGVLNLSHRNGHEFPEPMRPGVVYPVEIKLNDIGHRFASGNRIRIAISSAYWPTIWPAQEKSTLSITAGSSTLMLPTRVVRAEDPDLRPFEEPECAELLDKTVSEEGQFAWTTEHDMQTSRVTVRIFEDEGTTIYNEHDGWTVAASRELHYSIEPDDPESCKAEVTRKEAFSRRDWEITTRTHTVTSANRTHFLIRAELEAKHGDLVVHVQKWNRKIPRDLV